MATTHMCRMLLLVVCIVELAPVLVQATRPGPMLHGGTIILLQPRTMHLAQQSAAFDADTLDRIFDGPSIFGPSMHLFDQPSPLAGMFGEPQVRRPCPFSKHRPQGQDEITRHLAAARFGPTLLSSLLPAAEDDRERNAGSDTAVYTMNPAAQVAALQPRSLGAALQPRAQQQRQQQQPRTFVVASERFSIPTALTRRFQDAGSDDLLMQRLVSHDVHVTVDPHRSTMSISGEPDAVDAAAADAWAAIEDDGQVAAAKVGSAEVAHRTQPGRGSLEPQLPQAALAGATWRFKDFVSRIGAEAGTAAADDSAQRARFEGTAPGQPVRPPHAWFKSGNGPHVAHIPALSWDIFEDDGQLNGGVLIFLLLCIACAAVWSRLLVLWCTFRTASGCRALGRRRRCRRFGPAAVITHDDIKGSLETPLLNPLQHEAPLPSAGEHYNPVEVAATAAAPPANFVTLQYVPLKGEQ